MSINFVYIHSHDTGRWIQPYGYSCPTPAYQRFAEQGVLFRNAYCVGPTCSPSRAGMLTGMSPHSAGLLGLVHRGFKLNDPRQHLANHLRTNGYQAFISGVQHEASKATDLGYEVLGDKSHHPEGPAIEFLRSRAKNSQLFMLTCGWGNTHRKFPAPARDSIWTDSRYVGVPAGLPDCHDTREDMASFNTSLRELDRGIGALLAALDETGLADNTLVLITTDHGPPFPGMKSTCNDMGTGVLTMLRGPGGFTGGKVSDALVSQVDIFPTVCEVLGVSKPAWLQGHSLLPLVDGSKTQIRDEAFSEITYHACYEPVRSVRTPTHRYIRTFGVADRQNIITGNIDAGPSKSHMLGVGWGRSLRFSEELYDNRLDPQERVNLVNNPACQSILEDLRGRLRKWMVQTGDPLLNGHVPAPDNAVVGLQSNIDPKDTEYTGAEWNKILSTMSL
jgi:arylsulfatase A-like enzyme